MPYIKQPDRDRVDMMGLPENAGELNYAITQLVFKYLGRVPNYQRYNDVLGALEGAKLELYRRKIAPYEDDKIAQNGDVYQMRRKHDGEDRS
jgi:hypothetical protein